MSVEAQSWALNIAPVPVDSNGKPNDSCAFVLVGLANHAGPDGRGAFPSVKTLVRYTRKSERTVQNALARLEAEGVIRPCDPDIVAAHIKRADRRPRGWDLAIERVRTDLDDDELETLEAMFPGVKARVAAARAQQSAAGVEPARREPVDNPSYGAQRLHPVRGTGCNQRRNGVQPLQSRGAAVAPEPSLEPSLEPPPAPAGARDDVDDLPTPAGGGGHENRAGVAEVLDSLGPAWRLTAPQRRRLVKPTAAALAAGWSPRQLAAELGANPDGVRNPYAVLRSRLGDLAETPPSTSSRPTRPPHCGVCLDTTRQRETGDGRPYPCPVCHQDPTRRARGAELEAAQSAVNAQTAAPESHPLRLPHIDGAA